MEELRGNRLPLEAWDPFAPPHWRWRAAERIVAGEKSVDDYPDKDVRAAVLHLQAIAARQAEGYSTAIAEAYGLFRDDGLLRAELEARFIVGQTIPEIARIISVPVPVVECYRRLFFDVPVRATDYLVTQVIRCAPLRGFQDHEIRQFWTWIAMDGSPPLLDLLVTSLPQAGRSGNAPRLSHYLAANSRVHPDVQALVAASALPFTDPWTKWAAACENLLREFDESAGWEESLAEFVEIRWELLRAGRAALAGAAAPPHLKVKPRQKVAASHGRASPSSGTQSASPLFLRERMLKRVRDAELTPESKS